MTSPSLSTPPIPTALDAHDESIVESLRYQPVEFLTRLVETYGDIVRLPFGPRDLYVVNHPDYIRELFLGSTDVYKKRANPQAEQAYLESIAGFAALFQDAAIPGYAPSMLAAAQRTSERWRALTQNGPVQVDIYREMMRLLLEVVIQTLFRADASDAAKDLVNDILTMDLGYGFDPVAATLGVFMPPANVSLTPDGEAARRRILDYVKSVAATKGENPDPSESFLSAVLRFLGPEMGANVAMTVMFAMHEVSATTLTWAWYLLSQAPDVADQLHAELAKVLGGRVPIYEDIVSLPYTTMLLMEVRRLYPSVWLIGRFIWSDTMLGDYAVPADTVVLASQWVTHHDARYFPEPGRFDPLRWTPEAQADRPEFAYYPFSAGPRACAGEKFAETEDILILATLAQAWQASLVPGQDFAPRPDKSDAPRPGILMTIQPR